MNEPYERFALQPDLILTWNNHFVTVSTSRWEPGVFIYDIEFLSIEMQPNRGKVKVVLYSRGEHINFNALRFELPDADYRRFESFITRLRDHRDELRTARS